MVFHIPSTWTRIEVGPHRITPGVFRTGNVVVPSIPHVAGLPLELSGLLPNRDHNGDLFQALDNVPNCLSGERPVFGLFAADPFLRIDQLSDKLASKGYLAVANVPSTSQYGWEQKSMLDDLDMGDTRERRTLRAFKDRGFSLSISITDHQDLGRALELEPEHLFVLPSFDDWLHRKIEPARLLERCRVIAEHKDRQSPGTRIVLFAGRLPISATHARDAGADALLLD